MDHTLIISSCVVSNFTLSIILMTMKSRVIVRGVLWGVLKVIKGWRTYANNFLNATLVLIFVDVLVIAFSNGNAHSIISISLWRRVNAVERKDCLYVEIDVVNILGLCRYSSGEVTRTQTFTRGMQLKMKKNTNFTRTDASNIGVGTTKF